MNGKEKLISYLNDSELCPIKAGLMERCYEDCDCWNCWRRVIEMECKD